MFVSIELYIYFIWYIFTDGNEISTKQQQAQLFG